MSSSAAARLHVSSETPGRVLVLGASGFIGSHLCAAFSAAGAKVRAGARQPGPARARAPAYDWVGAEFASLCRPEAWSALLDGVDVVVNCVGVLQDGGGDSTKLAHEDGPRALIAACETAGVKRLVHVSAIGADDDAGTAYARSKRATERMLEASSLDYVILRPSLVIGRGVFGGMALLRGLAAFPGVTPVLDGGQQFRPVAMPDLCEAIVRLSRSDAPSRVTLDLGGPEIVSLADLLRAYRAWLGLKPAPVLRTPAPLAWAVLKAGDLLGRLGWSSPLRSTSARQMAYDVAGGDQTWVAELGLRPASLGRFLSEHPATVQDRWHARLYFVRPLAVVTLAALWLGSGIVSAVEPGRGAAIELLRVGGWPHAAGVAGFGAGVDIALGLGLLVRRWTGRAAWLTVLVSLVYLAAVTLTLPQVWLDPLAPLLKILPAAALSLFVAATDERR